jgi:predicted DNA-binding transcriptional regulator AlpA
MTGAETPFMRLDEIAKIHPVSDRARKAAEDAGLFPKRYQLATRVAGWSGSMVNEWKRDPNSWVHRARLATSAEQESVSG